MKFKGFWYDGLLIGLAAGVSAAFIVLTALIKPELAICEAAAFAVVCLVAVYRAFTARKRYNRFIVRTSKKLDYTDNKVLSSFPFPVVICDEDGYIRWCSERFVNEISQGEITETEKIKSFTNGVSLDDMLHEEKTDVCVNGNYYSVYKIPTNCQVRLQSDF